jgi:hypothetical protein
MGQATSTPAHIESLARKLEAWVATDLVDSERDALRQILIAAANGDDDVSGFMVGWSFGPIVVQAYQVETTRKRFEDQTKSLEDTDRL